ncbi:MAG: hypothetical protein NVS4B2_35180 [Chloroflexota bacterium]
MGTAGLTVTILVRPPRLGRAGDRLGQVRDIATTLTGNGHHVIDVDAIRLGWVRNHVLEESCTGLCVTNMDIEQRTMEDEGVVASTRSPSSLVSFTGRKEET